MSSHLSVYNIQNQNDNLCIEEIFVLNICETKNYQNANNRIEINLSAFVLVGTSILATYLRHLEILTAVQTQSWQLCLQFHLRFQRFG